MSAFADKKLVFLSGFTETFINNFCYKNFMDSFFIERERVFNKKKEEALELKPRLFYKKILSLVKNHKSVGIYGLRGAGKTTLVLQIAASLKNSYYFSCDSLVLRGIGLYDFISYLDSKGYERIFIDEIHAYPKWSAELKAAYDDFDAGIIFTGSSKLAIESKSEMLRRSVLFHLPPLSFREFIYLKRGELLPKATLKSIIDLKRRKELLLEVYPFAAEMKEFIDKGGLPIVFMNNQSLFLGVVKKIIDDDIPAVRKVDNSFKSSVYKILKVITTSSPGGISIRTLSNASGRHSDTVEEIITLLESSGLIKTIEPWAKGPKLIRKEKKITLAIPFRSVLANAYGIEPDKGALREDFFTHHLERVWYFPTSSKKTPDYVAERQVFEIGGGSKKFSQLKKKGFLVLEGLTLEPKKIPLILFGLLY